MNAPTSIHTAIDDSLFAASRALTDAENIIEAVIGLLTGEEASTGACQPDGGSILYVAERVANRAGGVAERLQVLRSLISAPKVMGLAQAGAASTAAANPGLYRDALRA